MVNQIGNNAAAKIAGAYASSGVASDAKQQPAVQDKPAVKLDLSTSTTVNADTSMTAEPPSLADAALVEEIRNRISNGTFQIDYQKIAGELLNDALAFSSRSR